MREGQEHPREPPRGAPHFSALKPFGATSQKPEAKQKRNRLFLGQNVTLFSLIPILGRNYVRNRLILRLENKFSRLSHPSPLSHFGLLGWLFGGKKVGPKAPKIRTNADEIFSTFSYDLRP